jgi:hypothetical protein
MQKTFFLFALLITLCLPAWSSDSEEAQLTPKTYEIRKLADGESIKLDGQLSEPAWLKAEIARDFLQQVPDEGKLATQKTEVRLLYDEKNLYVAYQCWQQDKMGGEASNFIPMRSSVLRPALNEMTWTFPRGRME